MSLKSHSYGIHCPRPRLLEDLEPQQAEITAGFIDQEGKRAMFLVKFASYSKSHMGLVMS
jgi:hypothetical protein